MVKTENNLYCVYVHRNIINNKRYVGITSKSNPKDRWGRAGNGYYNNRHFMPLSKNMVGTHLNIL